MACENKRRVHESIVCGKVLGTPQHPFLRTIILSSLHKIKTNPLKYLDYPLKQAI